MNRGIIVKIVSNLYTVKVGKDYIDCRARGKFRNKAISPLVGDHVLIDIEKKIIENIETRNNTINRPPIANIDYGLVVTSVKEPKLSLNLLDKQLCYLIYNKIIPIIIFTKKDLLNSQELKEIEEIYNYYKKIGIKVFYNDEITLIKQVLKNKIVVLTGQTGAGKSTLVNKLGNLKVKTDSISMALGRGKHTTRHVEIYEIDDFAIADTPGFSALDLNIPKKELKNTFVEFNNYNCKYRDCIHNKENECGVKEQVGKEIRTTRYDNYLKFLGE